MMFVCVARFKPGTDEKRKPLEPAFYVHLEQRTTRIRLGGPIKDDSGARAGIFLLIDAHDRAAAENLVSESPFTAAGLYQSVEITPVDIEIGSLG